MTNFFCYAGQTDVVTQSENNPFRFLTVTSKIYDETRPKDMNSSFDVVEGRY